MVWNHVRNWISKSVNRKTSGQIQVVKTADGRWNVDEDQFRSTSSFFPKRIEALERGTKDSFLHNGSFHEAIGPILAMAQCFAIMPVVGVKRPHPSMLHFTWKSFRVVYALLLLVCTSLYLICQLYLSFSDDLSFDKIVPVIFYGSCLYTRFCFGFLAMRWPKLMQHWHRVESELPKYQTELQKSVLAHKMKMLTIVVMTLSLVEHILSIVSGVYYSHICDPFQKDPITNHFQSELAPMFVFLSYRPERAFVGKFVNVSTTFLWTYMDLFVMLIGVGLSSRFRQINESLMRHKGQPMPEKFWTEHRLYYRNMCDLSQAVDEAVSKITMVSFANNLYFVCVQLLRSLNRMPSIIHAIYFWFSLVFLIARTLAVSLYSAEINDESKKPIVVFRAVPKESWCLEVKRFSSEVTNDVIALSGMQFFHITRKLVLTVAGTIVTYELVLIQFREDDNEDVVFCT